MMKKDIFELLSAYGINKKLLDNISIESMLGTPLNRDLNHFDKTKVLKELNRVTNIYWRVIEKHESNFEYRIKSIGSIERKFDKYLLEGRNFKKVFDDILGIRIVVKEYDSIINSNNEYFKIINMLQGKKSDDGYRGLHLYYQKTPSCYPIEIQIFNEKDKKFNHYLHEYIYKRKLNPLIGKKLKLLYDNGKIKDDKEFKEALSYVLCSSKKI